MRFSCMHSDWGLIRPVEHTAWQTRHELNQRSMLVPPDALALLHDDSHAESRRHEDAGINRPTDVQRAGKACDDGPEHEGEGTPASICSGGTQFSALQSVGQSGAGFCAGSL